MIEGGNLVYNKVDGTGAAVRLKPDNSVRDNIFNLKVQDIKDEKALIRENQLRMNEIFDGIQMLDGFQQDNVDFNKRVEELQNNIISQMQEKGGEWTPEDEMKVRGQVKTQEASRVILGREFTEWKAEIERAKTMDYDPESLNEMIEYGKMSPQDRQIYRDTNGTPSIRERYEPTLDTAIKDTPFAMSQFNEMKTGDSRAPRIAQNLSYDEGAALDWAETQHDLLYGGPNVRRDDPKAMKRAQLWEAAIADSLQGLTVGTQQYKDAFKKALIEAGVKTRESQIGRKEATTYVGTDNKPPKVYQPGWAGNNYTSSIGYTVDVAGDKALISMADANTKGSKLGAKDTWIGVGEADGKTQEMEIDGSLTSIRKTMVGGEVKYVATISPDVSSYEGTQGISTDAAGNTITAKNNPKKNITITLDPVSVGKLQREVFDGQSLLDVFNENARKAVGTGDDLPD